MNKVVLIGRLTKDPEVRYTQGAESMAVARYSIAVDRNTSRNGQREADFINCITFGKTAEFAERYLHKGMKVAVEGRIQTGSYTNRDGQKVYTTDVVVNAHEFCESLRQQADAPQAQAPRESAVGEGFMDIPDNAEAEGLPWN